MNFKKIFSVLLVSFFIFIDPSYASKIAKQVDFLLNGYRHPTTDIILSGGKVKTYVDGSSTLSSLWTNKDKSADATNPIILDSAGKAEVYADGVYKFEIYDSNDVLIETINGLTYDNYTISNYVFYPNYSASDQGVTGSNNTIKYYIDTYGTKNPTIKLLHNSGNATTSYALNTSETVPVGVKIEIEQGAIITIASGVVLTVSSPESIISTKDGQIFYGSGTVSFTEGGTVQARWFPGADIGAKINAASKSLPAGGGTVDVGYFQARESYSTTILWSAYVNIDFSRSKLLYTGTGSALVTAKTDRITANTQAVGEPVLDATLTAPDIQANGVCGDVFYLLGMQNCDILYPRLEKITADAQAGKALINLLSGDSTGTGGPGGCYYNRIQHPILIGGNSTNQRIDIGLNLLNLGTLGVADNTIDQVKVIYTATIGIKTANDYARDNTFIKPSLEGMGGATALAGTGIYEGGTRNSYIFPYGENLLYGIDRQATADTMWLIGENFQSSVGTKLNGKDATDTYIVRGWETDLPFTIGNANIAPVEIRKAFKAGGQPSVSVHVTGDLAVAASAGYVTLDLDDEDFDLNSDHNITTFTFTAPWAGRYQIHMNVTWSGVADGDVLNLKIYKNGTTDAATIIHPANGTGSQTTTLDKTLNLAAGDTLIFQVRSATNDNTVVGGAGFTWVDIVQLN